MKRSRRTEHLYDLATLDATERLLERAVERPVRTYLRFVPAHVLREIAHFETAADTLPQCRQLWAR